MTLLTDGSKLDFVIDQLESEVIIDQVRYRIHPFLHQVLL